MIEEDISDLRGEIYDLEEQIKSIIRFLPEEAFVYKIQGPYYELSFEFETLEDANEFVKDQITSKGGRFRKNSALRGLEISEVKINKHLKKFYD